MSDPNGCLLGIDLGTSGVRALLMDLNGNVRAVAHRAYPLQMPRADWVEQDPQAWWVATREAIRESIAAGDVGSGDVVAIGLSGQMHGLVCLDERDRVLRPAMLWFCCGVAIKTFVPRRAS